MTFKITTLFIFATRLFCLTMSAEIQWVNHQLNPTSFYLTSDSVNGTEIALHREKRHVEADSHPDIESFHVQSDVKYRFCRTQVSSRLRNNNSNGESQEATFNVILPERAFISKFVMEIDGTFYKGIILPRDEARERYILEKCIHETAGIVEMSKRDANLINVHVNIRAQSAVTFQLTYEELLQRKRGHYEHFININHIHAATVPDYRIDITIEDKRDLVNMSIPSLFKSVDLDDDDKDTYSLIPIHMNGTTKATISWRPTHEDQETLKKEGISGRFLVRYDVDRGTRSQHLLISQGYFIHFLAPDTLPSMRKHVVFILDVSGSMAGTKLQQLKDAMNKILNDLLAQDYFNIILFSTNVEVWRPLNSTCSKNYYSIQATQENVTKARNYINGICALGWTHIRKALTEGLNLISAIQPPQSLSTTACHLPPKVHSMIVFLTDGMQTDGDTNDVILETTATLNKRNKVPIFSLAFGRDAEYPFLKQLSLQNDGFARKIYESVDAPLQLENFYNEISHLLLTNATVWYTSDNFQLSEVTTMYFNEYFKGNEIVVAGKLTPKYGYVCTETNSNITLLDAVVEGNGNESSSYKEENSIEDVVGDGACRTSPDSWDASDMTHDDKFLEAAWAYMNIQELIQKYTATSKSNIQQQNELYDRVMKLSLQYGFVTTLTSLLVAKPKGNQNVRRRRSTGNPNLPNKFQYSLDPNADYSEVELLDAYGNKLENLTRPMPVNVNRNMTCHNIMGCSAADEIVSTLDQISWLGGDVESVGVNKNDYKVLRNGMDVPDDNSNYLCTNGRTLEKGLCKHLMDCVLPDFTHNARNFKKNFCPISSTSPYNKDVYLGVCCPIPRSAPGPIMGFAGFSSQ